jgi:hypothetical protein
MAEIIPYRFYRDPTNGRSFSLFTSWKTPGAVLVEDGFTIRWPDGTQGCGRGPFKTRDEAAALLTKMPKNFSGMNSMGN